MYLNKAHTWPPPVAALVGAVEVYLLRWGRILSVSMVTYQLVDQWLHSEIAPQNNWLDLGKIGNSFEKDELKYIHAYMCVYLCLVCERWIWEHFLSLCFPQLKRDQIINLMIITDNIYIFIFHLQTHIVYIIVYC